MSKQIRPLFLLVLSFLLTSILSCNPKNSIPEINRPRDVWVFRSVLDEHPRMLTAALNENMWLAYDTQSASLYKAWKGGVNFDGAVYTTKHGPQPTSLGYAYQLKKEAWILLQNGKRMAPVISYKGHLIQNEEVSLNFQLITPEGETVLVKETPRYISKDGKNGLERTFEITNSTNYTVALETVVSSLQSEEDYSTNGNFTTTGQERISFEDGQILEIKGQLLLDLPKVTLSSYYHPGFDKLEKNNNEMARSEAAKELSPGVNLIEGSDCMACHNEKMKTVGPSYLSIAEKYADDESTVKQLSDKIKNGGKGVWGEAVMTPHPDLPDSDIEEMVGYILSLDNDGQNSRPNHPEEYTLNKKSVPLNFKDDLKPSTGSGLVASLFIVNPETREIIPSKKAIVESVHVLDASGFGEHPSNIKIVFRGQITVNKTNSYSFRLISDDGSYLFIDEKEIIDNGGNHGFEAVDSEIYLEEGIHDIRIEFEQGGGGAGLSLQWFNNTSKKFELVPTKMLNFDSRHFAKTMPYAPAPKENSVTNNPGDQAPLEDVHPSFTLYQARPDDFKPRVGGIDFTSDGTLIVSTWDADGAVYAIKNYTAENPENIKVTKIAFGLAEPLGVKVVDDKIYVLQKQELTQLIDNDGDKLIDEYRTVSNNWKVSGNFHEFAFGLAYKDDHFYATLATAILPGGASAVPQIPDRGKVVKINRETGNTEFIADGLRTPNGIGMNTNRELFVADNQGDWLPASKIVHIQNGEFYGSKSVDPIGTANKVEKLPVVWLPQDEIGNSPSEPNYLNVGPYKNQLIHGEVTHGGLKRVAYEEVEGQLQGAVFRFSQGIEAGVNRICWAPDGSLIVGGIGVSGNWQHYGKLPYGLQRMKYNGKTTFEMLRINSKPQGFEIEFTAPLATETDLKKLLQVQQWYYLPTIEYGGPKLDQKVLNAEVMNLSDDGKKVLIKVEGLKENHVVYFHLNNKVKSETGQELWTTEAWYTLNKIAK